MRWARLSGLVLCMELAAGCGSPEEPGGQASAHCEGGGAVVALNRNDDDTVGMAEVIVADSDGDVELVTGDWVATRPSFSPDGRKLVVVRADGDYESAGPTSTALWTMNTDGTDPRALTEGGEDDHPAWSPDGATIAFSRRNPSTTGAGRQVMTVPARGGDASPLIPNDGFEDIAPAWSPDGRALAFIRVERHPDHRRITTVWTAGADGSNARPVAPVPEAHSLDWHPDGDVLLVSSFGAEDGSVALVDVDTGDVRQIAEHASFAAWSPDGDGVYYFTKDGAPRPSWWRLALGHVDGDDLERDRYVGEIEDYLYPYFGLAASPCP